MGEFTVLALVFTACVVVLPAGNLLYRVTPELLSFRLRRITIHPKTTIYLINSICLLLLAFSYISDVGRKNPPNIFATQYGCSEGYCSKNIESNAIRTIDLVSKVTASFSLSINHHSDTRKVKDIIITSPKGISFSKKSIHKHYMEGYLPETALNTPITVEISEYDTKNQVVTHSINISPSLVTELYTASLNVKADRDSVSLEGSRMGFAMVRKSRHLIRKEYVPIAFTYEQFKAKAYFSHENEEIFLAKKKCEGILKTAHNIRRIAQHSRDMGIQYLSNLLAFADCDLASAALSGPLKQLYSSRKKQGTLEICLKEPSTTSATCAFMKTLNAYYARSEEKSLPKNGANVPQILNVNWNLVDCRDTWCLSFVLDVGKANYKFISISKDPQEKPSLQTAMYELMLSNQGQGTYSINKFNTSNIPLEEYTIIANIELNGRHLSYRMIFPSRLLHYAGTVSMFNDSWERESRIKWFLEGLPYVFR